MHPIFQMNYLVNRVNKYILYLETFFVTARKCKLLAFFVHIFEEKLSLRILSKPQEEDYEEFTRDSLKMSDFWDSERFQKQM